MGERGGETLSVAEFLERLRAPEFSSAFWEPVYAAFEAAHAAGDCAYLATLAAGLWEAARAGAIDARTAEHTANLAVRGLALVKGAAAVDRLFALAPHPELLAPIPHQVTDVRARLLGAVLGFAQDEATLAQALGQYGNRPELRDVLAAWAMERVARGVDLSEMPEARRFWQQLGEQNHPLAGLPLRPLSIEGAVPAGATHWSVLGAGSWGTTIPYPPGPEPAPPGAPPGAVEIEGDAAVAWIEAAFAPSEALFNGRAETRLFLLDPPITAEQLGGDFVRALPADCLAGATRENAPAQRLTPEEAFGALFWAATYGGAYNLAWSGAYGRLGAFQSLRGIVGAAADTPLTEVEARARRTAFLHLGVKGLPWFERVGSDLCFAALRPEGDVLVLSAWTDTD